MTSRFKSFPFGRNKNKTSSPAPNPVVVTPSNGTSPTPHASPPSNRSSSTTSLSVNNSQPSQQLGRPPSYSPNRPTSPMAHNPHNPQHSLVPHPAPINPNMQYAQPGMQQPMNAPPGYGMPQQHMSHGIPPGMSQPQYAGRNPAVEIEGPNRNKAQLIVGIDFGTTFSGVAFAFATNNEAREDIITEWPGAGTHTKQKVSGCSKC